MRSDRLLSALLLLQAHGRLTGRELSQRLEVSARTIHRDMESLSAAGIPIFALRGAQGGWQLEKGWRTQVPGLDDAELRALLMAQPRVLGDPRLAAAAQRAIDKLVAALPTTLRDRAASIRQRLYIDPAGWSGSTTENLATLPIVQDALSLDRKLAIQYAPTSNTHDHDAKTERIVDPLGLIAKGNSWYLFAGTPRGNRTFAVSRIATARLLEQPSQRPPRFDLAREWNSSTHQYRQARPRYYATLRLEPRTTGWVTMARPSVPVDLPRRPTASAKPRRSKAWPTFRIQFDHEAEACFFVLGLGPRVDVIEPASLRTRAQKELAATIKRHSR